MPDYVMRYIYSKDNAPSESREVEFRAEDDNRAKHRLPELKDEVQRLGRTVRISSVELLRRVVDEL